MFLLTARFEEGLPFLFFLIVCFEKGEPSLFLPIACFEEGDPLASLKSRGLTATICMIESAQQTGRQKKGGSIDE